MVPVLPHCSQFKSPKTNLLSQLSTTLARRQRRASSVAAVVLFSVDEASVGQHKEAVGVALYNVVYRDVVASNKTNIMITEVVEAVEAEDLAGGITISHNEIEILLSTSDLTGL